MSSLPIRQAAEVAELWSSWLAEEVEEVDVRLRRRSCSYRSAAPVRGVVAHQ
jgi:hypothetical protein